MGYGRGGRMAIESDTAEVTAGVRNGVTLGSPISMWIPNADFENWRDAMGVWDADQDEMKKRRVKAPRPGHVDLAGGIKYDRADLRDVLERASARETAARVAAGAMAKELIAQFGIEIRSGVIAIGSAGDGTHTPSWNDLDGISADSLFRAAPSTLEPAMREAIDSAREAGETLGGAIVTIARGVPIGLGSYAHWDEKLDGRIAQAIMSVHAIKAVAIGDGIDAARRPGTEVHDPIEMGGEGYRRSSNRAGGLEGGVTNGEELVVRAFMKPISTTRRGLPSVDIETGEVHRSQWERSDVSAVPACSVICEAMLALVLADAMREKFGGDSLGEMKRNFDGYVAQVKGWGRGPQPKE